MGVGLGGGTWSDMVHETKYTVTQAQGFVLGQSKRSISHELTLNTCKLLYSNMSRDRGELSVVEVRTEL